MVGKNKDDTDQNEHWRTRTLLSSLPPTDPEVLREIENNRLSNAHYAMIGRVAAAWARFEVSIDLWLWDFAEVPHKVGTCFTAQLIGPRPRMEAFIALVRHFGADKSWNKSLEAIANDVTALAELRNRAVHDVWELSDASSPLRLERTAKRKVRTLAIHVPTKELVDLETNIIQLDQRFNAMAGQLYHQPRSLPDTLPSEPGA
jgi:hypothetical protein